jgi:GxxExxY protein
MRDRFRLLDEQALPDEVEAAAAAVLGCAATLSRDLGLGLRERIYQEGLAALLADAGHRVAREVPVVIQYRGRVLGEGYRMDLLVNDTVVVEVKSAAEMHPTFETQLLTYLRGARKPLGYVINFGMPYLSMGIRRKINSAAL